MFTRVPGNSVIMTPSWSVHETDDVHCVRVARTLVEIRHSTHVVSRQDSDFLIETCLSHLNMATTGILSHQTYVL